MFSFNKCCDHNNFHFNISLRKGIFNYFLYLFTSIISSLRLHIPPYSCYHFLCKLTAAETNLSLTVYFPRSYSELLEGRKITQGQLNASLSHVLFHYSTYLRLVILFFLKRFAHIYVHLDIRHIIF